MAATAVAKVPKVPSSSFSVLLKRSKFATYDPQIGQIYTTYGGSAHRGDWGLKRPLAVRRRDGRLIINNVDTLYQQTEWTSAYTDSMTMRKLEEMQITPWVDKQGSWGPRVGSGGKIKQPKWLFDSDYLQGSPEQNAAILEVNAPLPDTRAMLPKRFERYLRRLRSLGPEFKAFIEQKEEELASRRNNKKRSFFELATDSKNSDHIRFLSEKFAEAYNEESSAIIRPMPHPTGGLSYVRVSSLESDLDAKVVPGRRVHYATSKDSGLSERDVRVAVGGWAANEGIATKQGKDVVMTDLGTRQGRVRKDSEAGKDIFKVLDSALINPPEVVGKRPQRLRNAYLSMDATRWSDVNDSRDNPHKPGTPDYVAHDRKSDVVQTPPISYRMNRGKSSFLASQFNTRPPTTFSPRADSKGPSAILGTLMKIIESKKGSGGKREQ